MGLQALGDSSDSDYSNSTLDLSDKDNASHEISLEHIEIDTEIVKEDVAVKVCCAFNFIRL